MDRAKIVAYTAYESLIFGGKLHLPSILLKSRNFHCRWSKDNEPQSEGFKKALNMASSPLKSFNPKKRRKECQNQSFRLMTLILS